MNKHKSNKIKENSNTLRHLIMGQITTTQYLVAIKEVRQAGQWNYAQSLMYHKRRVLLFFKVICQIPRSHGPKTNFMDLVLIWERKLGRSQLSNLSDLPCYCPVDVKSQQSSSHYSGACFNIQNIIPGMGTPITKIKTFMKLFSVYNGYLLTSKMASLHWDGPLVLVHLFPPVGSGTPAFRLGSRIDPHRHRGVVKVHWRVPWVGGLFSWVVATFTL